ncbi:DUF72 domain-containing protein [Stutzerimonas sp. VN223-3]|uniref:DUF72 domain-containing protein n=1 Tax=Stutzerimonas sp. VN223-3 TaxID=3384601 RepID=UPI0038B64A5F
MNIIASSEPIFLGCAGWSLPRKQWPAFPSDGTHLQRYAGRFGAVEINSSFYRPHRPATYAKWAQSVPEAFRFCVKVPKQLTHEARLVDCDEGLDRFLHECGHLGDKLGCLLVQLPPSLAFDTTSATSFFAALRARYNGFVAIEPRHRSWLEAEPLLKQQRIARVAADPAPFPEAAKPGGWSGFRYYRLHGSPRIYYSFYDDGWLDRLAARLMEDRQQGVSWCIFDNTASGAATANALDVQKRLHQA